MEEGGCETGNIEALLELVRGGIEDAGLDEVFDRVGPELAFQGHLLKVPALKTISADVPLGTPANKAYFRELAADPHIVATMANAQTGEPIPNIPEMQRFFPAMDAALEAKIAVYLRRTQGEHGGWALVHKGAFDVSASVKAYFALKMIGDSVDAPHMAKAREAIRIRGEQFAGRRGSHPVAVRDERIPEVGRGERQGGTQGRNSGRGAGIIGDPGRGRVPANGDRGNNGRPTRGGRRRSDLRAGRRSPKVRRNTTGDDAALRVLIDLSNSRS